jgi:hypothetical protein
VSVTPRRGNPRLHAARKSNVDAVKAEADSYANVISIREAQKAGTRTLREIAEALNARGIAAARCLGQRYAQSVANILDRADRPWTSSARLRRSNL